MFRDSKEIIVTCPSRISCWQFLCSRLTTLWQWWWWWWWRWWWWWWWWSKLWQMYCSQQSIQGKWWRRSLCYYWIQTSYLVKFSEEARVVVKIATGQSGKIECLLFIIITVWFFKDHQLCHHDHPTSSYALSVETDFLASSRNHRHRPTHIQRSLRRSEINAADYKDDTNGW